MKGYAMSTFANQANKVALYSPPQINRRLPKKEPRPRQVKSMTIAAGFRCYDGVVICRDSEQTSGQSKSYIDDDNREIHIGDTIRAID
jgi:20S proteasome alpha/beta subunit